MKPLLVSIILLISFNTLRSQSKEEVTIFIKNQQGAFVENVDVFIENVKKTTENIKVTTDSKGEAMIDLLINQQYRFVVITSDYLPLDSIITIRNKSVVLSLQKINRLDEVVVTSTKKLITMKKGQFVVDTDHELLRDLPNTWEAIKNSPMVIADESGVLRLGSKIATLYINNKELLLSGEELKNYLENITVDDIKSLQLNTNPNASFDSAVQSIVHIKLKKNNKKSEQYRISSNSGMRTNAYGNTGFGYKRNTAKLRLNTKASFNYSDPFHTNEIRQERSVLKSETDLNHQKNTLLLNTDFDILGNHWFDFSSFYSFGSNKSNDQTVGSGRTITSDIKNTSERLNSNFLYLYTINDNTSINIKADYAYADNNTRNKIRFIGNNPVPNNYDQFLPSIIPIFRIASNFIKEKENGGYSIGGKYSTIHVRNDNKSLDLMTNKEISGDFNYHENIYALYFNKEFTWKTNYLSLGLRGELTNIKTSFIEEEKSAINDQFQYFNLVPTATLTLLTKKEKVYTIGLTSSVSRPSYNLLNPFNTFKSDILEFEGDLRLAPQQQYGLELGYNYKNHGLLIQGSYIHDFISTYIADTNGQLVSRYSNFKDVYLFSINYSFQKKITSFWRGALTSSLLYPIVSDERFDIKDSSPAIDIQMSSSFAITKKLRYNINFEYESSFRDGFFEHRKTSSLFSSITYRLKKPNFHFTLYADDILKTNFSGSDVLLTDISYKTKEYNDSFMVGLQVVYTIGKTIKNTKKLEKDSFDELDRVQ